MPCLLALDNSPPKLLMIQYDPPSASTDADQIADAAGIGLTIIIGTFVARQLRQLGWQLLKGRVFARQVQASRFKEIEVDEES